jgi:hypothetical protein
MKSFGAIKTLILSVIFINLNSYAIERVTSKTSLDEATVMCTALAKNALKRKSTKLVIGIEGLVSFKQRFADSIYDYQDNLLLGKNVQPPRGVGLNFVAKNLVKPHMKKNYKKVDYLLMPETSESAKAESVNERCIKSWYRVMGDRLRVVIASHSFGGNAARMLVQKLEKSLPDFKEIQMLTIDPRTPNPTDIGKRFYAPVNVRDNFVFYQKYTPFLWGYPFLERANTVNRKLLKDDFAPGSVCRGNSHARTTCAPAVVETYLRLIRN